VKETELKGEIGAIGDIRATLARELGPVARVLTALRGEKRSKCEKSTPLFIGPQRSGPPDTWSLPIRRGRRSGDLP
jgi:hypothetical protein